MESGSRLPKSRRRVIIVATVFSLFLGLFVSTNMATQASASQPQAPGVVQPAVDPYQIVATYTFTGGDWPLTYHLRYGTPLWGWQHIVSRGWPNPLDGCIYNTLALGTTKWDGTSETFNWHYNSSPGTNFRVVYETGSGDKGIITAYNESFGGSCW